MSSDKYHHFVIDVEAVPTRGHTKAKVLMDGIELKGVRGIKVKSWYSEVTEVTLTFVAGATLAIDKIEVVQDSD